MKSILGRATCLALMSCISPVGIPAQEPLTLRQAIQIALKQSPDVDAARAGVDEAKANPSIASKLSFVAMERIRVVSLCDTNLVVRGWIPSLSAGPFQVEDIPVLVKDLSSMRRLDSHIVGIVGQNFLSQFNYLIDYGRDLVWIESGNEIRDLTDGDHVAIESTENRMMVPSEAQSRGNAKLRLVLDSGAHSLVL